MTVLQRVDIVAPDCEMRNKCCAVHIKSGAAGGTHPQVGKKDPKEKAPSEAETDELVDSPGEFWAGMKMFPGVGVCGNSPFLSLGPGTGLIHPCAAYCASMGLCRKAGPRSFAN